MRHGDKVNNLGRKYAHRQSLLSGLACHLIEHKRIVTTVAKAKALRVYVEPLITKSKENTTHQRRVVFKNLGKKEAVTELFGVVSPKIGGRPGGYTRIIKLGKRVGDNAELAMIELVDFNEIYGKGIGEDAGAAQTKKTRRSRRKKSGSNEPAESAAESPKGEKAEASAPKAEVKEDVKEEKKTDAEAPTSDKEEEKK